MTPSLWTILELVRRRPSMYIGYDDSQLNLRWAALESLISGYSFAVHQHQLVDPGLNSFNDFPQWLRAKFGWSMSCGPFGAIRLASRDEREAWERFWILLKQFQDERGETPPALPPEK